MIRPEAETSPYPPTEEETPKPIAPYDPSDKMGDPRDFAFAVPPDLTTEKIAFVLGRLIRLVPPETLASISREVNDSAVTDLMATELDRRYRIANP